MYKGVHTDMLFHEAHLKRNSVVKSFVFTLSVYTRVALVNRMGHMWRPGIAPISTHPEYTSCAFICGQLHNINRLYRYRVLCPALFYSIINTSLVNAPLKKCDQYLSGCSYIGQWKGLAGYMNERKFSGRVSSKEKHTPHKSNITTLMKCLVCHFCAGNVLLTKRRQCQNLFTPEPWGEKTQFLQRNVSRSILVLIDPKGALILIYTSWLVM